jgi:hypothetical protein
MGKERAMPAFCWTRRREDAEENAEKKKTRKREQKKERTEEAESAGFCCFAGASHETGRDWQVNDGQTAARKRSRLSEGSLSFSDGPLVSGEGWATTGSSC